MRRPLPPNGHVLASRPHMSLALAVAVPAPVSVLLIPCNVMAACVAKRAHKSPGKTTQSVSAARQLGTGSQGRGQTVPLSLLISDICICIQARVWTTDSNGLRDYFARKEDNDLRIEIKFKLIKLEGKYSRRKYL